MALIIKGDMPKNCLDKCWLEDACSIYDRKSKERPSDCPILGEMPDEHGRLGDLDRVRERLGDDTFICYACRRLLNDVFDTAPTIVEAST